MEKSTQSGQQFRYFCLQDLNRRTSRVTSVRGHQVVVVVVVVVEVVEKKSGRISEEDICLPTKPI
jgi:hypothetical protein